MEADDSNRPLLVGERTNDVIGSRAFKDLVNAEKWEEAGEIARRQVRNGAQVIDVCLQSSERDERKDIPPFYESLIRKIKAPIMIDTTDPASVELALTYCQGKSIINSINLEDGEDKFERICPLARSFGAALVIGCIDEDKLQAQAFTRERKLAVAERSCRLPNRNIWHPRRERHHRSAAFSRARPATKITSAARWNDRSDPPDQREIPGVKTIWESRISRSAFRHRRAKVNSRFSYYRTKAGPRSRHREHGKNRTLRVHPGK